MDLKTTIVATYDSLCNPAKFYFIISTIFFVLLLLQNLGQGSQFNLGVHSVNFHQTPMILIGNLLYLLAWTWLLNIICKHLHPIISWVLVFFPLIISFFILVVVFATVMAAATASIEKTAATNQNNLYSNQNNLYGNRFGQRNQFGQNNYNSEFAN